MKAFFLAITIFFAVSAQAQTPFSLPTCNEPGDPGLVNSKTFSVFPNPSNGRITVAVSTIKASQFSILIYNIQRQLVSRTFVSDAANQASINLNLCGMQSGNYFVVISNGQKVLAKTQLFIS